MLQHGHNGDDGDDPPDGEPFPQMTVPAHAPIQAVDNGLNQILGHGPLHEIAVPRPVDLPEPVLQHIDPDDAPGLSPFSASIPTARTQAMKYRQTSSPETSQIKSWKP